MENGQKGKIIIDSLNDLSKLGKIEFENEVYFSEDILQSEEVDSVNEAYNIFLRKIFNLSESCEKQYSIQIVYINRKKYFHVEKRNLIDLREQQLVMNLLEKEFGKSLLLIAIFGSYITKEDGEYSDYDLVVVLDSYENNNIYEREKKSPKLKRNLKMLGIKSLFAFNFTTKQELENAHLSNPWVLETMGKSFYILKDRDSFLESILTQERGIKYLGNFTWEGESLNTKKNLDRIDLIIREYKTTLNVARQNGDNEFVIYYNWEIKKLEIIMYLLNNYSLYVSRFDFDFICKEKLNLGDDELSDLYSMYKESILYGKREIYNYSSIENNINFSEELLNNGLLLPCLNHRYIALRNILSKLLHKTGNFIIDGEFTQKFLQIFGDILPDEIQNSFYDNVFKAEQILGRTGYLSFDFDQEGNYIFEKGDYNYEGLIKIIDSLIQYFQKAFDLLLKEVGEKQTKISIISSCHTINTEQFIFPNNIEVYYKKDLKEKGTPKGVKESDYIFVLNSNNNFSSDYLLKLLSGFNKNGIMCVSGNRVSNMRNAGNKFCNFAFKREDYEREGNGIFKYALRSVGTQYFTS